MERALERALEHAEHVIECAKQSPSKRKYSFSGEKSLFEKLNDIYNQECEKEPEITEELRSSVNLLGKLVARELLPCFVVNLYPGEGGYSLMLKGEKGSSFSEIIRLPYEKQQLLEYLDAEEVPPILVDLLKESQVNIFHSGCVIAEIRDYGESNNMETPGYQSRHILLHPTMQTLVHDAQSIASDHQKWIQEDRLLLESQLLSATTEPLGLDPSISVACTANRLLYDKQKMNTHPMKRSFERYSTPSLNEQEELFHCPPPFEPSMLTTDKKVKESGSGQQHDAIISKAGDYVDMWEQRPCDLDVLSELDVENYTEGKMSVKYDDSEPIAWPAYEVHNDSQFGWESGGLSQKTKLSVMMSFNDPFISGKSSCKKVRCEQQMTPTNSSTDDYPNSYRPESKHDAAKVVRKSKKMVPQNTKCPGKKSHSYSGSAGVSQPFTGREKQQPKTIAAQSSVQMKGITATPPPIRHPSSSGKSSSANSFLPQKVSSFLQSPDLAPKQPSLSKKLSVGVNEVNTLPATALPTASSLQIVQATQVPANNTGLNIIGDGVLAGVSQAVVRGPNLMQVSSLGVQGAVGIQPYLLPSGACPPNAVPAALQLCQIGTQLFLINALVLSPITVLQLPPVQVLHIQQWPVQQWPVQQWQQQQCFYQLVPQQQLQQPRAPAPQQPAPQSSSAQHSAAQKTASAALPAVAVGCHGQGHFLQPQGTVVLQVGPGQGRPQQSLPQQGPQQLQPVGPRPPPPTASQPAAAMDNLGATSGCGHNARPNSSATRPAGSKDPEGK
ncbi:transcription factor SPT20 homolog [Manis pentadactyla]|uniref:transcription factor SPT20 homolog n=1 Tax=Manis pentadactyla TaxID=143292 RepID=UPI00255C91C9|nr:transcription factor SPT20 homolog [Manis pentadactyla]